jgi:hypothetical protein
MSTTGRPGDAAREKARRLRSGSEWDASGVASVHLPVPLAEQALTAAGYRPAGRGGGWTGPDGERYGSLDEATSTEFTACAIASAEATYDPTQEALRQIREVAKILAGQLLMSPEDQISAFTAKLERIGNIAAEGEPDEDWRPALIEELG